MKAIAQLPPSASEEATARVLEATPVTDLDPLTKIEVLRKEQANIKAARTRTKQERTEQKKVTEDAKAKEKPPPSSETVAESARTVTAAPDEKSTSPISYVPFFMFATLVFNRAWIAQAIKRPTST